MKPTTFILKSSSATKEFTTDDIDITLLMITEFLQDSGFNISKLKYEDFNHNCSCGGSCGL